MSEPKWDSEKGTVTLVKGDSEKTFDLNNEDDRLSMMKLGQRGWYYDEDASKELGQLRTVIKNWDSAIEAAKTDDDAMKQLVGKIELATGKKLTRAEKSDLEDGVKPKILIDEEENEGLLKVINSLKSEISELKKSQTDFKSEAEKKELEIEKQKLEQEALELEKKYNGDKNTPKFKRDEVFKFASDNGITDVELAFKMMNFENLTEFAKKNAVEDYKKQMKDRQSAFTETEGASAEIETPKPSRSKNYFATGQNALKSAKEKGYELFTND